MKYPKLALVMATLIPFPVFAYDFAPLPECNSAETNYMKSIEISTVAAGAYTVINKILLCDESSSSIKFWFMITGHNAHFCDLSGEAKKSGEKFLFESGECNLIIERTSDSVKLHDSGHKCKMRYCGANVYLNGQEFNAD